MVLNTDGFEWLSLGVHAFSTKSIGTSILSLAFLPRLHLGWLQQGQGLFYRDSSLPKLSTKEIDESDENEDFNSFGRLKQILE